jgi:hypothetical protein
VLSLLFGSRIFFLILGFVFFVFLSLYSLSKENYRIVGCLISERVLELLVVNLFD